MQDIVNYFLFALNLIIFATVAFAALAYGIQHLNQKTAFNPDRRQRASLPLYDILLDFHHRDVDHWYSWINVQSSLKQEQALQMLINYLSEPIDEKGLVTRDVLKIITKFPCEDLFVFLEGFSKSALRNWHKNKAIASFYEQSLLSMIEADSAQAATSIVANLGEVKNEPSKDIASKYMVSALTKLKDLAELKHSFKEIALDEFFSTDFRIDSLDTLKLNSDNYIEVVAVCLKEMLGSKLQNFPLYNYFFNAMLESKALDSSDNQELLISCFMNTDTENESTQRLLEHLALDDFFMPQSLVFKILNAVSPKNYKFIKKALINKSKLSSPEIALIDEQELVADNYEDLSSNSFDFKIFNFKEPMKCDPFLNEEWIAMDNVLAVDKSPCLKVVYGKSKLEKLYIAKVLASIAEKSLLVFDLENILDLGTDLSKLDQVLSQNPNKIVFLKNLKFMIDKTENREKRRQAVKLFSIIKKYLKYSTCNFIACVEDKLEDLMDGNEAYRNFFDEHSDVLLHSYTFDLPSIERKRGIYQKVLQHIEKTRTFDLNSFDELKETVHEMSHFEYMNFIYKFFHDSLLTFKKVMSIKKYNHLLKDKKVFETKKPLLNLNYVS